MSNEVDAEVYRNVASDLRYTLDNAVHVDCSDASGQVRQDIFAMIDRIIETCERKATRLEGG